MCVCVCADSLVYGFGGYFHCVLYGKVEMSIVPHTHSPGMFSWFPLYIPIRHPMNVRAGEQIECHFWRRSEGRRMWYEWALSAPSQSAIHNVNGRSYCVGL